MSLCENVFVAERVWVNVVSHRGNLSSHSCTVIPNLSVSSAFAIMGAMLCVRDERVSQTVFVQKFSYKV